jgi:ComF family protein
MPGWMEFYEKQIYNTAAASISPQSIVGRKLSGNDTNRLRARGQRLASVLTNAVRRSVMTTRKSASVGISAATAFQRLTLDLVFPRACVGCQQELDGNIAPNSNLPLCGECLEQVEFFRGPTCRRCGAPVPDLGPKTDDPSLVTIKEGGCYRCRGRKLWFDETIAVGHYAGGLRELLLRMKRAEGDSISLAVGQLLWQRCGERLTQVNAHVVVPIPLHWRRRLVHRTNSAAVVAEVVAGRLGLPLAAALLRRRRHTTRQFDLTPPQRWDNVRHAFAVRGGYHLQRANVLLVDDILTTGATCSEAARTLRKAGAERVTIAVVARAFGQ